MKKKGHETIPENFLGLWKHFEERERETELDATDGLKGGVVTSAFCDLLEAKKEAGQVKKVAAILS